MTELEYNNVEFIMNHLETCSLAFSLYFSQLMKVLVMDRSNIQVHDWLMISSEYILRCFWFCFLLNYSTEVLLSIVIWFPSQYILLVQSKIFDLCILFKPTNYTFFDHSIFIIFLFQAQQIIAYKYISLNGIPCSTGVAA